jgi:hypothetical protein
LNDLLPRFSAPSATPRSVRLLLALACALGACEGERGPAGPAGGGGGGTDDEEPTPTEYEAGEPVPHLETRIEALEGASGPAGEFQVGDLVTVEFSLLKEDGEPWMLEELIEGEALVSGPSFNYQRVLPAETDVLERATEVAEGRFRFTFSAPIPAVYAPPYNDTTTFGANGGELAGRALLDGTYTVGLSFTWEFEVDGLPFRRVGEAALDFLLGTGAGTLTARAVTSEAHCNRCHGELQAHDGRYRTLELCLLCHTSGAEDGNDPAVAGGTPTVTIDSRVLFHKVHSGRFLPSVNGMTTRGNGSRNYDAAPVPLQYVRSDGTVRDFSHVGFPVMPNRLQPMPRDTGYASLSASQQLQEDTVRSAPTTCAVCHGDPDGPGPIVSPAQADLINIPSRRACGACHDDVNFANSYRSNGQSMPPQPNDLGCRQCHDSRFPSDLSPVDAHVHPLDRTDFDAGLHVALSALAEGGAADLDGTLDPGEEVVLEFALTDDEGDEVSPPTLDELRIVLAGPSTSFQVLLDAAIPTALVTGVQPFQLTLPERIELEFVGDGTAGADVFVTARAPHRLASGVTTNVLVRTGTAGGASALVAAAVPFDNFLDLADATGFARDDFVVVGDGVAGAEEYLRVQLVEGNRLWFSAPNQPGYVAGLRHAHPAGAAVLEVQLAGRSAPGNYTLDPATGTITEVSGFGAGNAVLVSYTTDYVLPDRYPGALNGSPEVDDGQGSWTGKTLVSGTYRAALSAARELEFELGTTITTYRSSSPGATLDFLVGDAFELEPFARIADGNSCNACHRELSYHGTTHGPYQGFDTCIACHGAPGTEDLPRYVAANAPETPGRSVEFRNLLHRIHRGRQLEDDSYLVVSAGTDAYPDNFSTRAYHGFSTLPAFPGRTLECARCHGEGNTAALLPAEREHPDEQVEPVQIWRAACASCHDGEAVIAHVDSNTAPDGAEACAICHAAGEFEDALADHQALLEPR